MENVRLFEVDEEISVGMGGGNGLEDDFFSAMVKGEAAAERACREGLIGCSGEVKVKRGEILRSGEPLSRFFVGDDSGSGIVKGKIAVGVIEVPVSIDQIFKRGGVELGEGLQDSRGGGGDATVDNDFSFGARENADVAACAGEHGDAAGEFGDLDGAAELFAECVDALGVVLGLR